VYHPDLVAPVAHVLQELGAEAACVVNSAGGLDELSTEGPNRVTLLREGIVSPAILDPGALGLDRAPAAALRGGDATENAAIVRAILAGERGPRRDVTLLNAGMALSLAGAADDLATGIAMAAEAIDSGAARQVLERVIAFSGGVA
jgi:anthranilate phosphoribosyltransferase